MILVTLLYPDGQRREVILATVPVEGDTIRLRDEPQTLLVRHRLLMEASNGNEPVALISVRKADRDDTKD